MKSIRMKARDAHECCLPYIDTYGQPTIHTFKSFPPAATHAEYRQQVEELTALLDLTGACTHMKEIAIATHKTLCGNEDHVKLENHAWFYGVSPEEFEELMSTP